MLVQANFSTDRTELRDGFDRLLTKIVMLGRYEIESMHDARSQFLRLLKTCPVAFSCAPFPLPPDDDLHSAEVNGVEAMIAIIDDDDDDVVGSGTSDVRRTGA